jgi:predicted dehydrogenase
MPARFGVIGAGTFGINHLRAFRQLAYTGQAELVALADLNENTLRQRLDEFPIRGYADYREMLAQEQLDAVSIATPDHLHRDVTVYCARAGKHVLVEKPLDVTVAGCQAMIDAARETGVLLQVDFHKRYDPEHEQLQLAVRNGDLGDILYGTAHMEDRIEVPLDWFPRWAGNSSPVWFLGVHFFDLVRWVLGCDARRVFATGQRGYLKSLGVDTFDSLQTHVEFMNGASVCFDTSWVLPRNFEAVVNQGLRLVGTRGLWEIDTQNRGSQSCSAEQGMRTWNSSFLRERKDQQGRPIFRGYGADSIEDFAKNVNFLLEGGALDELAGQYATGEDGLEVTKIAVAAHRSIETREPVDLDTLS